MAKLRVELLKEEAKDITKAGQLSQADVRNVSPCMFFRRAIDIEERL